MKKITLFAIVLLALGYLTMVVLVYLQGPLGFGYEPKSIVMNCDDRFQFFPLPHWEKVFCIPI